MLEFSTILERIKDILSEDITFRKVLDKDVAETLHIHPITFASMKKRNSVPFMEILQFCARKKISINWLLFNQSPESLIDSTQRYSFVRYFDSVQVSAGGGADNDILEEETLMLEGVFADKLGGERHLKHIEAVHVSGDSMEPVLSDGDIVFVDRSQTDYGRGGIFVITTEYGVFVKRLQKRLDGRVDIVSDNKEYPVQTIESHELEVIGKVQGAFAQPD